MSIMQKIKAAKTGDKGGVCAHSTPDFWQEYDLYKIKDKASVNDRINIPVAIHCGGVGLKRMVYRRKVDGFTEIGTVIMMPTAARRQVWEIMGLVAGGRLFEDEYFQIGKPDNLGGGTFTRTLSVGNWDDPADAPLEHLGYLHPCGREQSYQKGFAFDDFQSNRWWYLDENRVPYPGRKTRSLGAAFQKSEGARYGDAYR